MAVRLQVMLLKQLKEKFGLMPFISNTVCQKFYTSSYSSRMDIDTSDDKDYEKTEASLSDNGDLECKPYSPEDFFETPQTVRRESTIEDEQRITCLLKEILEFQEINVSSWVVENKVKILCYSYKCLLKPHKDGFLKVLATKYSVDHQRIYKAMNQFKDFEPGSTVLLKAEEQLKTVLTPQYSWLFKYIGRLENGVKFLVDMRIDVLDLLAELDSNSLAFVPLQHLNSTLKDLLSLWFTVGFLNLERITWKSPCEMLQKISDYEAVHPVRSWTDLKRRVGAYRRCFVFTHSSMPAEPLVVLHTALSTEIASSMKGIVAAAQRMSVDASLLGGSHFGQVEETEEPSCVKAAIFYSITSTQKGLQGIELGNYLIKRVVKELQSEFPSVTQFSSLSPIPSFKSWLLEKVKNMEKDGSGNLPTELWNPALEKVSGSWKDMKKIIYNNSWLHDNVLSSLLQSPLMTACAYYLYKEKRRGGALDNVANFHLRNGAMMWRLNWLADASPRGMSNSCGMMVNYRYYLEETESNSINYLEKKEINASEQIRKLVGEIIPSKM